MEDEHVVSDEASQLEAWNRRALQRTRSAMLAMIPFVTQLDASSGFRRRAAYTSDAGTHAVRRGCENALSR